MAKRKGSGRATINDVAQHAKVGAITVSRMLRDPSKVSEKLRTRIEESIRVLKYIPDQKARALASGRNDVIGVLVPSLTNNVFSDTLRGIHDAARDTPFQIQIANTHYSVAEEDHLISLFVGQRPAALIVTGRDQSEKTRNLLSESKIPIVQIIETDDNPIDMVIGFSHSKAAMTVIDHLVEQGYRRIGFIGARLDPRLARRLSGYKQRLTELDLFDEARIAVSTAASSVNLGRDFFKDLQKRDPKMDAVFCGNDDMALGVLFECLAQNIQIPTEMGIAGFNDLEFMSAAVPPLTSVLTHRYEIGYQAVDLILKRLNGEKPNSLNIDVGYELQARESTALKTTR
ncbi:HTH-type transcriptional regulator GntR [Sneathiella aquimaris]|uniref:LacI family DNA-binding transcriptional regulator n=1 Tax=Sneathiella aquimaris TaxID=2599305 RepID=UPI00146B1224|nr:LacI family DNA-binding transcriptional regulator [Sneathiella aquimaris]